MAVPDLDPEVKVASADFTLGLYNISPSHSTKIQ